MRIGLILLAAMAAFPPAGAWACTPHWGEPVAVAAIEEDASLVLGDGRRVVPSGMVSGPAQQVLRHWLAERLAGRAIRLGHAAQRLDRWGRTRAMISLDGREILEETAIRAGLALAAPGIPDRECARRLHAAETRDMAAPSLAADRLGGFLRAEGVLKSLRKTQSRVYMKLDVGQPRRLMVTMRLEDFASSMDGGDVAMGAILRVRGHLEWWGEPTIAASAWDVTVLAAAAAADGAQ